MRIRRQSLKEVVEIMTLKKAIGKFGTLHQTCVAMGELAELCDVLAKSLRLDRDEDFKKDVLTEVADVYVVLEQIKIIYDLDDKELAKEIEYKINRLAKKLEDD